MSSVVENKKSQLISLAFLNFQVFNAINLADVLRKVFMSQKFVKGT